MAQPLTVSVHMATSRHFLTYATADLAGCMIRTDDTERYALWRNVAACDPCEDDILPETVYVAELERSWSVERFQSESYVEPDTSFTGTSWNEDGSPVFNDGNMVAAHHVGLAEAEEMPIAQAILINALGIAGYSGPRYVYRNWTQILADNWPKHQHALMRRIAN